MNIEVEFLAFAVIAALAWGLTPVISKRGMAKGASASRATVVIIGVNVAIFWLAIVILFGNSMYMAGIPFAAVLLFVLTGIFTSTIGWLAWMESIDRIGATISNAIWNVQPLFATLFAIILIGERLTFQMTIGIIVIVLGLTIFPLTKGGDFGSWSNYELLIPIGSAAVAGLGAVAIRFGLTTWAITVFQAIILHLTSAFVVLVAYYMIFNRDVLSVRSAGDGFFVGSGIFNAVAIFAFYTALENEPVAIITPIAGTAPLITAVLSHLFLGDVERVTWGILLSIVMVIVGVILIVT